MKYDKRLSTTIAWSLCVMMVCSASLAGCARRDYVRSVTIADRHQGFHIKRGQKVAVLSFTGGSHGKAMSDMLSIELLRRGVKVVERDSLDRLVAEVGRGESGLFNNAMSDAKLLQKIGKIVGVDVIIVGEVWTRSPTEVVRPMVKQQGLLIAGGALLGSIILFPIGIILVVNGLDRDDFGEQSPYFGRIQTTASMRAFSTSEGRVLWWGGTETHIEGGYGDHVRLLDNLRYAARHSADAMMSPTLFEISKSAENSDIPTVFGALGKPIKPRPSSSIFGDLDSDPDEVEEAEEAEEAEDRVEVIEAQYNKARRTLLIKVRILKGDFDERLRITGYGPMKYSASDDYHLLRKVGVKRPSGDQVTLVFANGDALGVPVARR